MSGPTNLTIEGHTLSHPPWTWSMLKEALDMLEEQFPQYEYKESGLIVWDERPERVHPVAATGDIRDIENVPILPDAVS